MQPVPAAMKPRMKAIPRHELVGMGSTTSQLSAREWKPLQSPRRSHMMPAGTQLPKRSPMPKDVVKQETTASLLMLSGSTQVRLYRELVEFERANAARPALEGGSVVTAEHLTRICSIYHDVCDEDSPGLVTRNQLQAIIRGSIIGAAGTTAGTNEEKYTARMFKLRNPHETGRVDFPKFLVEFMMPVKVRCDPPFIVARARAQPWQEEGGCAPLPMAGAAQMVDLTAAGFAACSSTCPRTTRPRCRCRCSTNLAAFLQCSQARNARSCRACPRPSLPPFCSTRTR
jgi:hypothetical protein